MPAKVYCFERAKILKRMKALVQEYEETRLKYQKNYFLNFTELQTLSSLHYEIELLDAQLRKMEDESNKA